MRLKEFNWVSGLFIISYHAMLFALLPYYLLRFSPSGLLLSVSVVLLALSGISISAGYHRFYSHKAYTPNKAFESVLLFFGTMAFEGSALYWSHEHRIHHRFTDREEDPHSIKEGFMHAHMLWIFKKPGPIDMNNVQDLSKNRIVMFQHKYYGILATSLNLAALYLVWILTGDLFGTFVFAFLGRIFLLHHFTWFINSLAHTYGAKTYSAEQSAVDNYMMALVTFGEGYHNYHHVFASDYRNGIRWYHFDPSKWLIWTMNKLGLAKDLKKMNPITIKRTIINEDKKIMLEKLNLLSPEKQSMLKTKIDNLSAKLHEKMAEMSTLWSQYQKEKSQRKVIKSKLKAMNFEFKKSWNEWVRTAKEVTRMDKKSDFKYITSA